MNKKIALELSVSSFKKKIKSLGFVVDPPYWCILLTFCFYERKSNAYYAAVLFSKINDATAVISILFITDFAERFIPTTIVIAVALVTG